MWDFVTEAVLFADHLDFGELSHAVVSSPEARQSLYEIYRSKVVLKVRVNFVAFLLKDLNTFLARPTD